MAKPDGEKRELDQLGCRCLYGSHGQRQRNSDGRPAAGSAVHIDLPAMQRDDAPALTKTEPQTAARFAPREKRIEDFFDDFRWYAGTVVSDGDLRRIALVEVAAGQLAGVARGFEYGIAAAEFNGDIAALAKRFQRVSA